MAPTTGAPRQQSSIEAATETTPLLTAPEANGPLLASSSAHPSSGKSAIVQTDDVDSPTGGAIDPDDDSQKPFPLGQILLLCLASMAEPIACFVIFPFINEMLQHTGNVPLQDLGNWAGLIESLFSVVQMFLMLFYGRVADRMGRKPVLIFSLVGMSVTGALFGVSRDLPQMILYRCINGLFGGSVITIRTMLSENCTKYTQGRAFSWFMFVRNIGMLIGPLIGGSLVRPVERFPGVFGHAQFFSDYPFALSTFVGGGISLLITLPNMVFLKETLPSKLGDGPRLENPMSTWDIMKSPGVSMVLYIYAHTQFLGLAYTACAPTYLYIGIPQGGFGFDTPYIGYFIAIAAASQGAWMILAFPFLQRRLGTGTVLRACTTYWPIYTALFPILNQVLRRGWVTAFYAAGIPLLVFSSGVSMAFACVQLCLNDISPSPTALATLNALALTLNSAVRAVTPALINSILSIGTRTQWADGQLVWIVITAAAAAMFFVAFFGLPKEAEGKLSPPAHALPTSEGHERSESGEQV